MDRRKKHECNLKAPDNPPAEASHDKAGTVPAILFRGVIDRPCFLGRRLFAGVNLATVYLVRYDASDIRLPDRREVIYPGRAAFPGQFNASLFFEDLLGIIMIFFFAHRFAPLLDMPFFALV